MPRVVDTNYVAEHTFRADTERLGEEYIKKLIDSFLTDYDSQLHRYIISFERGSETDKPHFQGYIEHHFKANGYAQNVGKYFKELKPHEKSFAPKQKDFWKVYIVKDGDIRWLKGFSDEELAELRSQYDPNFKQNNKKGQSQAKRDAQKKNFFIDMMKYMEDNGINYSTSGWEIAETLLDYYELELKCEPNDFQLRCYCKSIQRHFMYSQATPEQLKNYRRARAKVIIGHEWVTNSEIF